MYVLLESSTSNFSVCYNLNVLWNSFINGTIQGKGRKHHTFPCIQTLWFYGVLQRKMPYTKSNRNKILTILESGIHQQIPGLARAGFLIHVFIVRPHCREWRRLLLGFVHRGNDFIYDGSTFQRSQLLIPIYYATIAKCENLGESKYLDHSPKVSWISKLTQTEDLIMATRDAGREARCSG